MKILRISSLLIALVFAGGTAGADGIYSGAVRLGPVDLSVTCPAGSVLSPTNGGECQRCRKGSVLALGKCTRLRGAESIKASLAYTKTGFNPFCRFGTFIRPGTRQCWKCPRNYAHNPAKKVTETGVCWRILPPVIEAPIVTARAPLKDLLNPGTLLAGAATLGCGGYGKSAFFDPIDFGSCWRCPASHPRRTLSSVKSARACASRACGAENGRPCYVWERIPSCNRGLIENPITNRCVPPSSIACRPLINTVRETREAIRRAEALIRQGTNAAADQVPGLDALSTFAANQQLQLQEQLDGAMDKLPTEKLVEKLADALPSPGQADQVAAVLRALIDKQGAFERLLLNPDIVCDGKTKPLEDLIGATFSAALAAALAVPPDVTPADRLEIWWAEASAAIRPLWQHLKPFAGHGFAVSTSFSKVFDYKAVQTDIGVGIELAIRISDTGQPDFALYLVGGGDGTVGLVGDAGSTKPDRSGLRETEVKFLSIGSTDTFVSYLPPIRRGCAGLEVDVNKDGNADIFAAPQIEVANTFSVSFACLRTSRPQISAINLRVQNETTRTIERITRISKAFLKASPLPPLDGKPKTRRDKFKENGLGIEARGGIGFNFGVALSSGGVAPALAP